MVYGSAANNREQIIPEQAHVVEMRQPGDPDRAVVSDAPAIGDDVLVRNRHAARRLGRAGRVLQKKHWVAAILEMLQWLAKTVDRNPLDGIAAPTQSTRRFVLLGLR
jgi:hypothetical protein